VYVNVLKEISVEMASDEEDVNETTKTKDKGCRIQEYGKEGVMYRAAKHVGIKPTMCFESGGHVVGRIKHVELNLEA